VSVALPASPPKGRGKVALSRGVLWGGKHVLQAGYGQCLANPTDPAELGGYGPELHRLWDQIHDNLWVRALALREGESQLTLAVLDSTEFGPEVVQAVEARLARNGLGPVMVAATHSHSTPSVLRSGWDEFSAGYVEPLADAVVEAVRLAEEDLEPAEAEYAESRVTEAGFNRAHEGAGWDDTARVVRFRRKGRRSITLLAVGIHPVSIDMRGPLGRAVSADWPGVALAELARATGDHTLFVLGPCGDVDPVVAWHQFAFEGARLTGALIAERVLQGLMRARPVQGAMAIKHGDVPLPLDWPWPAARLDAFIAQQIDRRTAGDPDRDKWTRFYGRWADSVRQNASNTLTVGFSSIAFGSDLVITGLQGEVFSSVAKAMRQRTPFSRTLLFTLNGASIGYIPDPDDFRAEGYAATLSPCILGFPLFRADVGDVLAHAVQAHWRTLYGACARLSPESIRISDKT
jgi:hypothetical protein